MTKGTTLSRLGYAMNVSTAGLTLAILLSTAAGAAAGDPMEFSIPEQDVASALKMYAEQADVSIMFPAEEVGGQSVRGLSGDYDPEEALELLLKGTGLKFERTPDNMISIKKSELFGPRPNRIELAQAQRAARQGTPQKNPRAD